MKTLLITGFEPFGEQAVNPSWECVKALPRELSGARIIPACLPVVWDEGPKKLASLMDEHLPDAVLCVGQAGGSEHIRVERVAINLKESESPDNLGRVVMGEPVVPGGPDAYFATLPVRDIRRALELERIPAAISYSAGAYLCNSVMYAALHHANGRIPAGFLHIPYMEGQSSSAFTLPLPTLLRAVSIAALTVIQQL